MAYGKNNSKKAAHRENTPPADRLAHRGAWGKELLDPRWRSLEPRGRRGP